MDFFNTASQQDNKLRGKTSSEQQIFEEDNEGTEMRTQDYVKVVEKKRLAEAERFKGNEFMKSKEFDEAIAAYTRSI